MRVFSPSGLYVPHELPLVLFCSHANTGGPGPQIWISQQEDSAYEEMGQALVRPEE